MDLPENVTPYDLEYPKFSSNDPPEYEAGNSGTLTFYKTASFGWCLATLFIGWGSRSSVAASSDRTYAIRVDTEELVRVGKGPHVTSEVTIYLKKSRMEALKKYVDLYTKGLTDAGTALGPHIKPTCPGALRRSKGGSGGWPFF